MDLARGFRKGFFPGAPRNPGGMGLRTEMIGVEEGKVGAQAGDQEKGQAEEPGAAAACG